ncbi:single-stranded-DNA-specific exonuclease RecJ [Candidatus Endowatersipora endosymbiont of Watersipora subatra]|uniref:single-stranded-DNA-specific exonuclease RecJ n=1 Tax=Candidatus Endowatersipora endosymbiont of Watersipora subatra TaxID=3077946 RepID=UPI00312C7F8F
MDHSSRLFLGVESSILGQKWEERLTPVEREYADSIADNLDIKELVARVLVGRGITMEQSESFLHPTLRDEMPDPSNLTDMDRATDRLVSAIINQQRVVIFGDYDVDGATSAALMSRYFTYFDLPHEIYIPDRIFEGYGPNKTAIEEMVESGIQLIITVDCGSVSVEILESAIGSGVDVVVIDHHQVGDVLPEVCAVVNPNRNDDLSGQGHLSAVGIVFLVLVSLNRVFRKKGNTIPDLRNWLDIVALGTVCDLVPLKGLNRPYVLRGLDVIRRQRSVGLTTLSRVSHQDGPAMPSHLAFLLGPRINAGGRIGNASLGARLLTTQDWTEAEEIAVQLDQLNTERQAIESVMLEEAINQAESQIGLDSGRSVLVTESDHWHAGVVGLIASRLKDRYRRPVFAIAFDDTERGQGSARSVVGIDIGHLVRMAVEERILEKGGGHAMAAGISIKKDRMSHFRSFMEEALSRSRKMIINTLKIDSLLTARSATKDLFDDLQKAGPYGSGHSQPIFVFPRHIIRHVSSVGKNHNHIRFRIESADGATLDGIGFGITDSPLGQALLEGRNPNMHLAGTLEYSFYHGRHQMKMRLIDAAIS